MAQQELDRTDVGASFEQVRSEAVSKHVGSNRLGDATVAPSELAGVLEDAGTQRLIFAPSRKEPGGWALIFPVLAEQLEELRRKHNVAVLVTLSLADPYHHTFGVYVRNVEMECFADS
jgi:hypothetical protein